MTQTLLKYMEDIGVQYTLSPEPVCRLNRIGFTSIQDLERFYINELDHPLKKTALNTVFSNHNTHAKVVLIGEAPGADEDAQGLPFVGKSGQLLTLMLKSIGLERDNVYITNLVPWRPPLNRNPTSEEMAFFLPYLHQHIRLLNPVCVMLLGSIVTKALFGEHVRISSFRGQWHDLIIDDVKYKTLPTFHPSYLLRSPRQKKLAWMDMQLLKCAL